MLMLAIESATIDVGAAMVSEDETLAAHSVRSGGRQTEVLHTLIARVLEDAAVQMNEVDAIGVDVGPGLFTGLRVGLATAKTLAFALGVPIVGCRSTEAMLWPFVGAPHRTVAIVDMRRSEVAFAIDSRPFEARLSTPADCVAALTADEGLVGAHLVGDGVARYFGAFERAITEHQFIVEDDRCRAVDVGLLGQMLLHRLEAGGAEDLDSIGPVYLRDADTRIGWTTRDLSRLGDG